jgi:cytochrome P450
MSAALPPFNPFSPDYLRDPAPVLKAMQASQPVFFFPPLNSWVVTRYDDVKAVALDAATFSSEAGGIMFPPPDDLAEGVPDLRRDELITTMDPPVHTRHRNVMAKSFAAPVLSRMEAIIAAEADRLIDGFIDRGEANLMEVFAVPLTINTIAALLGVPGDRKQDYREWSETFFSLLGPRVSAAAADAPRPELPEQDLRHRWTELADANRFFADYVAGRRDRPGEDIISAMLALKTEEGEAAIDDGSVVRHIISLIGAGHDTTANAIGHAILYLSGDPAQRDAVAADPALVENAVEETLRMRGSAAGGFRWTTKDVTLSGTSIPAQSMIYVLFAAAGHDETVFPDSLRFDVRRENAAKHLAFGFGRHSCIGSRLGRLQAQIALTALYRRIPDLALHPDFVPNYLPALAVTNLQNVDTVWAPTRA